MAGSTSTSRPPNTRNPTVSGHPRALSQVPPGSHALLARAPSPHTGHVTAHTLGWMLEARVPHRRKPGLRQRLPRPRSEPAQAEWGVSGGPCGPQCVSEGSQGRQGQRGSAAMPSGQQGPPGVSGRVAAGPSPTFKQENQSGHGWLVRETFNGLGMCTLWL